MTSKADQLFNKNTINILRRMHARTHARVYACRHTRTHAHKIAINIIYVCMYVCKYVCMTCVCFCNNIQIGRAKQFLITRCILYISRNGTIVVQPLIPFIKQARENGRHVADQCPNSMTRLPSLFLQYQKSRKITYFFIQ